MRCGRWARLPSERLQVGDWVFCLIAGRLEFRKVVEASLVDFTVQNLSFRVRALAPFQQTDEGRTWVRTVKEVAAMRTVAALTDPT